MPGRVGTWAMMQVVRSTLRSLVPGRRGITAAPALPPADAALVADLCAVVPGDRVRTDDLERHLYRKDASVITGTAGPVVLPVDTAEVQAVVRVAARHGRAVVPRGAGTGLSGGATPLAEQPPVVITTAKMDRILSIDAETRVAWVQPGVLNLDLSRAAAHWGLHFAPDPSSQQSCTIGGNVANNSGGPHCLAYGVTNPHVLACEVVLADGSVVTVGGLDPDPPGLDLRGAFVGSEGTMGIATRIAVRLMPIPRAVRTLLADFATVEDAAATVSAVIAAGIVPAAMEMMDARITAAVEAYVHAGFPLDAAAVLLVEVDGLPDGVAADTEAVSAIATANGARTVRVAVDPAERALLWKGRKSAFGAIARIAPDYYLHDAVVPRRKLVEVLAAVYLIADRHQLTMMNVFHAGDGNLHPLIVFDAREPGVWDRVHQAGVEILTACVEAGGVLSGEHGIGLEKRDFMHLVFTEVDLDHQDRLRRSFDPERLLNPGKVLPGGSGCGESIAHVPEGAWI